MTQNLYTFYTFKILKLQTPKHPLTCGLLCSNIVLVQKSQNLQTTSPLLPQYVDQSYLLYIKMLSSWQPSISKQWCYFLYTIDNFKYYQTMQYIIANHLKHHLTTRTPYQEPTTDISLATIQNTVETVQKKLRNQNILATTQFTSKSPKPHNKKHLDHPNNHPQQHHSNHLSSYINHLVYPNIH